MWRYQRNQIKVVFRFSPPNFVSDYQYSNCWIQKYTNWEFVLHSKQVLPLNLAMQVKWRPGNRNLEYSCQIQISLQTSKLFAGLKRKTGIIVNIFSNLRKYNFLWRCWAVLVPAIWAGASLSRESDSGSALTRNNELLKINLLLP